jgi:hypothetical protein
MSHAKQASKRRGRRKAVTVLGVAGMLSLGGGASGAAVGPTSDAPTENTAAVITLGEEEISDISLTTFYVFDNENAGAHRPGLQLCQRRGRAYRSCTVACCGGCGGCSGGTGNGGCGGGVDGYWRRLRAGIACWLGTS